MAGKLDHMYLYEPSTGARLDISPRSLNGGVLALGEDGYDLGFPTVRENSEDRPQQSGQYDYTSLYGARTITVSLKISDTAATPAAVTRRLLRGWMDPSRRVQLVFQEVGDVEMYADLISNELTSAMNRQSLLTGTSDVVLAWKCPRGHFLSTTVQDILIPYSGVTTGRSYPLSYPRTYPPATGVNAAIILNAGSVNSYPIVRLFGPMTAPKIANETTGLYLEFTTLTIAGGDFIEIDLRKRTVQLNGQAGPNYSRRGYLSTRQWWSLAPGYNTIRYSGSGAAPAAGELLAQDTYL